MKKDDVKEEKVLALSEPLENKEDKAQVEEPKAPVKPTTYVHVDQFLQTAIPLFGLNRMQARGFKTKMFGRQYLHSMEDFVKELEQYLGKKLK